MMTNETRLVGVCFSLALATLVACKGGDDGVDCGTFVACGGDIAGVWTIEGSCGNEEQIVDENCPAATITSSLDLGGTVTFGADGSYTAVTTVSGSQSASYPASCLTEFQIESCEALAAAIGDGATCTGSVSTSCNCTLTFDEEDSETGTYVVSGNTASITTTGSTDTLDYCVEGNTMKAREQGSTGFVVLSK